MSTFEEIINATYLEGDGSYLEGEEAAIEQVAVYEDEMVKVYNVINKMTDQILGVVAYPESVVDALRQVADEIEDTFGDHDEA